MTTTHTPRRTRKPPADKQPPAPRHAEPERPDPGPGQTALPLRPLQPTLWSI